MRLSFLTESRAEALNLSIADPSIALTSSYRESSRAVDATAPTLFIFWTASAGGSLPQAGGQMRYFFFSCRMSSLPDTRRALADRWDNGRVAKLNSLGCAIYSDGSRCIESQRA